jgi:hypothetical protein
MFEMMVSFAQDISAPPRGPRCRRDRPRAPIKESTSAANVKEIAMKLRNRGLSCLMLMIAITIGFGSRPLHANPIDPILPAPPLPGPTQGAIVYEGGAVLKNQSNAPAADVHIGFMIPGIFRENINQLAIALGVGGVTQQILSFGNQFATTFDKDIIFRGGFTIPPKGILDISTTVDSRNTNGLAWLKTITLTDEMETQ